MTTTPMLTSLTRARSWIGVTSTNDDDSITTLVGEVSRFILSYLERPSLFSRSYTEMQDGAGQVSLFLKHWPVTAVQSLTVEALSITQASGGTGAGYVLEPWSAGSVGGQQRLSLRGYCFRRGVGNVSIAYQAGYVVSAEARSVPASSPYTLSVNAPYGSFGADAGVQYANGTPLVLVSAAPAAGQYTVSAGVYSFAAADAGALVNLSYSYIPSDIEHACVALVAERYRYRNRVGEVSRSIAGQESVTYSQKPMPEFVRTLLQPYRRVLG